MGYYIVWGSAVAWFMLRGVAVSLIPPFNIFLASLFFKMLQMVAKTV